MQFAQCQLRQQLANLFVDHKRYDIISHMLSYYGEFNFVGDLIRDRDDLTMYDNLVAAEPMLLLCFPYMLCSFEYAPSEQVKKHVDHLIERHYNDMSRDHNILSTLTIIVMGLFIDDIDHLQYYIEKHDFMLQMLADKMIDTSTSSENIIDKPDLFYLFARLTTPETCPIYHVCISVAANYIVWAEHISYDHKHIVTRFMLKKYTKREVCAALIDNIPTDKEYCDVNNISVLLSEGVVIPETTVPLSIYQYMIYIGILPDEAKNNIDYIHKKDRVNIYDTYQRFFNSDRAGIKTVVARLSDIDIMYA